jgi:hypothetical protein
MTIDITKPLKMEDPATGGTEFDEFPTFTNPAEDYSATKGIAFEGLSTFLIDKIGRTLSMNHPLTTQKYTYSGNNLTVIEQYNSVTQITANRITRTDITYFGNNPTTEVTVVYDTDGTTVLRTTTWTYTFTGNNLTFAQMVIT